MMDPHNPQMQYYNQQNDWTGVKLSPHEDIPQHQYSSSYYGRMQPPPQDPAKDFCSSYYGRMQPPPQDPAKDFYAHHMMQMAQVAQAPRRGRKPLNEKKKRRKRNRPGSHIKRAKTAYFFFLDVFRKSYSKDGDQIPKASEITKACGKQWGIMTELDKKPYADKAAEDRKRYESEIAVYRKVRDPDKPKKPATAFFYFLTDFRAQMAGQKIEKGRRLTVICGEEWNKLTDQQKKPYLDKVAIEYKKYQERMEEYRRTKGMASPPQSKSRPPEMRPPDMMMPQQSMPSSHIPIPLSYNGKPAGAGGLPMQVPHDDEDDDDDLDDDEEEEEDDL